MPVDTVAQLRVSGQQDFSLGGLAGSCICGPLGREVWVAKAVTGIGCEDKRAWNLPGGQVAKTLPSQLQGPGSIPGQGTGCCMPSGAVKK